MGTGGTVYALQIKWEFSGKAPVFHNNNRKRSVLFECGKTQREKGNVRPNLSGREDFLLWEKHDERNKKPLP